MIEAATQRNPKPGESSLDLRRSSLDLRRLPFDIPLFPGPKDGSTTIPAVKTQQPSETEEESVSHPSPQAKSTNLLATLLRTTCLNPKWSLRSQLMLSFGSISVLTIAFVVAICILCAQRTGNNLKDINQESLQQLSARIQGTLAPYLAESLTPRLIPSDVVQILVEATQDRFAGYPNPTDEFVPFLDMESKTNIYPVRGKPLPLAWQFDMDRLVTEETHNEYVQDRWPLFAGGVVSAEAMYFMRGICDPNETNSSFWTYWPNCTNANNNVTTGGVDAPSPTNEMIYRKASDLGPLMKTLFEYHQDLEDVFVFFVNSGAGGHIRYPHAATANNLYVSLGCDWMNAPNPYNLSVPIGTPDEIHRCRPNGTTSSAVTYNFLERDWCPVAALNPNRTVIIGPYIGVSYNHLILSLFRAVYDRVTHQFIGAVGLTLSLTAVQAIVEASSIPSIVEVSLVRWDAVGTLVASSNGVAALLGSDLRSIAEIGVGVSPQTYQKVWTMVDYDAVWDPLEVRNQYATYKAAHQDGFQVSASPVPPIPDSYDVNYRPEFLVFLSLYENAVNQRINDVNDNVDHHEQQVVITSVVLGAAGIVLMLAIILTTSNMITWPLRTMNKAARDILSSFGQPDKANGKIEVPTPQSTKSSSRCIPRTELSDVTEQFNKMLIGFSGSSMATAMRYKESDGVNKFTFQDSFRDLYNSRNEKRFSYQTDSRGGKSSTGFIHAGSNIMDDNFTHTRESLTMNSGNLNYRFGSPLFVWITILIVIPLILTTGSISTAAMYRISHEFQDSINFAEETYITVELSALTFYAQARADYVSSATAASLRDLHLLTRYTGWLLFGGLNRTDSFVDMISGPEPCKAVLNATECGYYKEHFACDCAWNDVDTLVQCETYTTDSRYDQKTAFCDQSLDTWPNGDRNSTRFPKDSYSPQSTAWWFNVSNIPGSAKGALAGGDETAYDRLRVASAIPLFQVLYNYDKTKELAYDSYVAFEADGLFVGYSGCSTVRDSVLRAQWVSSVSNGAAKLRPELCPVGKYGYDPRCREWYDTGRKLAADNISLVYVMPTYVFASGTVFGLSATAPFTDPATKESVGQVLIDFLVDHIYSALQNRTVFAQGGFPILITVRPNNEGADAVIGPGLSQNEAALPISPLVLPFDQSCATDQCRNHLLEFEKLLTSMRMGVRNISQFYRTSSDGSAEKAYIAYAPINAAAYQPVNSSDFGRGVEPSEYLVYSLGLVETESGLLEPFSAAKSNTEKQIHRGIIILSIVIFVAILFIVYLSYVVTSSLTEPIVFLVKVIQGINRLDVDDDPPKIEWSAGSQELTLFSDTMDSLYRVMRAVNRAYFGGNLEKAYFVLDDTLTLFRRLGNEKAIGVACNNLGNVMLALYRRMQQTGAEGVGNLSRQSISRKGILYYTEAIQLGEKAYEQFYEREGWSPSCLDFMQHLSNRYFNRAMFLLMVDKDHDKPDEMEKMGLRDVQISRDMDVEITGQGEEVGWGTVNRTEQLFEVALVRARGHILLQELGYPDDWDLEDVLNSTFRLLMAEMKRSTSSLFREIGPIGRLQQLETVLIRYHLVRGFTETAARIAIRSLVEDEYILPDAEYEALHALELYVTSLGEDNDANSDLKGQLRQCLTSCEMESPLGKSTAASGQNTADVEDELEVIQRAMAVPFRQNVILTTRAVSSNVSTSQPRGHIGEYVTMEVF